jgi:Rieske 2Fe-2S family protein
MFDAFRIDALLAARRPGHALPRALYNSPEVFEFDLEAIYGQAWLLAGFACELPEARSTLALTIGRSPIVLTRDREGALRGFHNACRHRGAQICPDGADRRSRLTCPYHQWVYDLDGRLVSARHMQPGFDLSRHGLVPIHVEEVEGAIFVSLAETPPPFAAFRAALAPMLAPHRLRDAKVAAESTLVEKGNWKLVMENARECYHCAVGHPELSVTFPIDSAGPTLVREGADHAVAFAARMAARGLPMTSSVGPWWQVERFPLNPGRISLTMDGAPAVKKLMVDGDDPDIGSLRWAIDPHSFCHSTADATVMFSAMPTAPNETRVLCKWLVHRDAVEGSDYEVDRLTELWTRTNLQDRDLVEMNQRGVNALGFIPGPYNVEREAYVLRFTDWYCDAARAHLARLGGGAARRAPARGEAGPCAPAQGEGVPGDAARGASLPGDMTGDATRAQTGAPA